MVLTLSVALAACFVVGIVSAVLLARSFTREIHAAQAADWVELDQP